jgi:signal transduction histidine kinase
MRGGEAVSVRVLILEDSPDDAELLLIHLRKAGYRPDWRRADSPGALRSALAESTWDLVLADYSMPQFTAPDALAIIKEHGLDVPFIIVSGSVGEPAAVEAMKAGAHDFFLKDNLARLAVAVERERGEARVRKEHRETIAELHQSEERLRDAVRARDEFLSIASHELKTPLTSLSFQVETARQLLDAPTITAASASKLTAKLAGVSRQVTRLTTLINNLLDVTRIASGRMALSPETSDLRGAVETVLAGARELLARSGSKLEVRGGSPVIGEWDPLKLESMIFNLVSNAIKYGDSKAIEIDVGVRDDQACLIVTDHGVGIPVDEQERIFRRFERAVPEQHFGGFGLGLWVAREIIEAHGGTIAVASSPGKGSTFTVLLPLSRPGRS